MSSTHGDASSRTAVTMINIQQRFCYHYIPDIVCGIASFTLKICWGKDMMSGKGSWKGVFKSYCVCINWLSSLLA
jgi:hypothetical protein